MPLKNLTHRNGKWIVHGQQQRCVIGRDSFKLANMVARGMDKEANQWVEFNQRLLGEHCFLRVFGETGGWNRGHPMFGSPPSDPGIWNIPQLQKMVAEGRKLRSLTDLNMNVIEWFMKTSHETGVCFEYVVDATLKHTDGLSTMITDNAIRLTAQYMRELYQDYYPNAVVIVEARNEWRAHNAMNTKLNEVNMWAQRFHRWKRGERDTIHSFTDPGGGYNAEQWPESYIIQDESVNNKFKFECGLDPHTFDMGCIHPDRGNVWWRLPDTMGDLRSDCRGAPLGFNESMLYCDRDDMERCQNWYGSGGWTTDLNHYIQWLDACTGERGVDYFVIHDEKGMQTNENWPRPLTRLEEHLGGIAPPPPGPTQVTYKHVIRQAFRDILRREADLDGLEVYDNAMRHGLTEARMREAILRDEEFAKNNQE
jgi:hypothetical protein